MMDIVMLFSGILNMSLRAGYCIAVVVVLRFLLRRQAKILAYALWGVVLFRLLCPFSLTSSYSLLWDAVTIPQMGQSENQMERTVWQGRGGLFGEETEKTEEKDVTAASAAGTVKQGENSGLQIALEVCAWIWIGGIALLAVYSTQSVLRLRRLLSGAVFVADNLYEVEGIATPFVFGVLRPRIYLPAGLPPEERPYVLEHERVHVARKDYLVKLLFWGAVCLHWFNPLVWLAFFLMENDMEMSCDEAVLRRLGGEAKRGYSQALLSLSSEGAGMIGNPVSFGEGVVKKRICNILGWRRSRMVTLICLSVLLGGLAAGLALNPADQKEAEENLRLGFVSAYANAYCDRDGDTLVGMYVDEETAFENVLLLDRVGGTYSFGLSSPWPNEFRFRLSEEGQAEIWYYAWTSDPHVVVWKEEMRFDPGKRRVTGSEIHYLDRISSQAEFEEAYLIGGEYQFTDYVERGFADSIQTQTVSDRENGEEDRNVVYRSPDTAAEWILNLDGGKGEVISDSPNGRATVRYTFGDGSSVEIPMYNAGGDAAADDTGETEDGSLAGMALWLLDLQAWKA